MKCRTCGTVLEQSDKFCSSCGTSFITQEETAAAAANEAKEQITEPIDVSQSQNATSTSEVIAINQGKEKKDVVEETKSVVGNYWEFFVQSLKTPTERAFNNTKKDFIYAYIHIVIFSAFAGFGAFSLVRSAFGGFNFIGNMLSLATTFLSVYVYSIITLLMAIVFLFGALKLLSKVEVKFNDVLGRFGSLLSIPLVLSFGYFLFAIPGLRSFTSLFTLLMSVGVAIAMIFTFNSYQKERKPGAMDPILALFILFAVFGLYFEVTSGFSNATRFLPF